MTIAELYRAEAARCLERAQQASTPEREIKWRRLSDDCLQQAMKLEATDREPKSRWRHAEVVGVFVSSRIVRPQKRDRSSSIDSSPMSSKVCAQSKFHGEAW